MAGKVKLTLRSFSASGVLLDDASQYFKTKHSLVLSIGDEEKNLGQSNCSSCNGVHKYTWHNRSGAHFMVDPAADIEATITMQQQEKPHSKVSTRRQETCTRMHLAACL